MYSGLLRKKDSRVHIGPLVIDKAEILYAQYFGHLMF